jgi:hypothetical protein
MHLFLDANIYLAFYRLSEDNLDELKKLRERVRSKETILYLTDQVRDEFRRNREAVIDDAISLLKGQRVPNVFPRMFANLPDYEDVRATLKEAEKKVVKLIADGRTAAATGGLHADVLIAELFELATPLALTDDIWVKAQQRVLLGKPPGKHGRYGDAVHWESLLAHVPDGANLVLVTSDTDFISKFDGTQLREVMRIEWNAKKRSLVSAYPNLKSALTAHFPEIQLVAEPQPEVDLAVERLTESWNFKSTHDAIRALSRFHDFTPAQVVALVDAALDNSQVRAILQDDDVWAFYDDLARDYANDLDGARWSQLSPELMTPERVIAEWE